MTGVSVEQDLIECDLAQTRARMDTRLTDLQKRLSPGQVIDDLMTYFRGSEGGDFARNLMSSVRDNPLAAALTGIGLTWLMASSTHTNGAAATAAVPPPARKAAPASDNKELELRVLAVGTEIYRLPNESETGHRARIDDARGDVLGLKRQADDTAASFADRIGDALATARQGVTEKLHDLQDGAADTIGQMKDSANQAMGKIGLGGGDAAQRATAGLMATLTGNPVALGAMGLMLGAVLGALVPQSETEEAALGGVAERAGRAAVDLAQQAADKGGEIARKVVDAGMDSAHDHGLTADKPVSEIFEEAKSGDLVDHVKQIAQQILKTAMKRCAATANVKARRRSWSAPMSRPPPERKGHPRFRAMAARLLDLQNPPSIPEAL